MKPYIIGNWKMNPESARKARTLFDSVRRASRRGRAHIIVCPPLSFLPLLSESATKGGVSLGAQNLSQETGGAHTGEISAEMLTSIGARYVIVGHSERRAKGETDSDVAQKASLAIENKISPIICVGENERDEQATYFDTLARQVRASLARVTRSNAGKIIVAYEPVWAVGGNAISADTPEGTETMALFIRKILTEMYGEKIARSIPILYGGSVDKDNAYGFLFNGGVQGLLVGRASLNPKEFSEIIASTKS